MMTRAKSVKRRITSPLKRVIQVLNLALTRALSQFPFTLSSDNQELPHLHLLVVNARPPMNTLIHGMRSGRRTTLHLLAWNPPTLTPLTRGKKNGWSTCMGVKHGEQTSLCSKD